MSNKCMVDELRESNKPSNAYVWGLILVIALITIFGRILISGMEEAGATEEWEHGTPSCSLMPKWDTERWISLSSVHDQNLQLRFPNGDIKNYDFPGETEQFHYHPKIKIMWAGHKYYMEDYWEVNWCIPTTSTISPPTIPTTSTTVEQTTTTTEPEVTTTTTTEQETTTTTSPEDITTTTGPVTPSTVINTTSTTSPTSSTVVDTSSSTVNVCTSDPALNNVGRDSNGRFCALNTTDTEGSEGVTALPRTGGSTGNLVLAGVLLLALGSLILYRFRSAFSR